MSYRILITLPAPLILLALACADPMGTPAPPALHSTGELATVTYEPVVLDGGMGSAAVIGDDGTIFGVAGDATGYPAVRWTVTGAGVTGPDKLGVLPYPYDEAHSQQPHAMNGSGVVVGTAFGRAPTGTGFGAWIYTAGTMRLLPWFVGRTYGSQALGINEHGIAVGLIDFAVLASDGTVADRLELGAVWLNTEDEPILLPPLHGHDGGGAGSINSAGLVTGWSSSSEDTEAYVHVTWHIDGAGQVTDGPHALEPGFRGSGLNEAGDVAGSRELYGGGQTPALLRGGRYLDLALLRTRDAGGRAAAVGEPAASGGLRVVGHSGSSPVLWTVDVNNLLSGPSDLGLPGGSFQSGRAASVNGLGWIVGSASPRNGGSRPVLWLPQQSSGSDDGTCKPKKKCS
jgi:hypothetical protein